MPNGPIFDLVPIFDLTLAEAFSQAFDIVIFLAPVWVPVLLIMAFAEQWMDYIRLKAISSTKTVVLEVKVPRETNKSPRAMELVFTALYQKGAATHYETYKEGKYRTWFSFELASLGGNIHFFIWTEEKYKGTIESQIYAQYPNVEIYEVPDYTKGILYNGGERFMWGTQHKLSSSDVYPIKTYVDYNLDVGSEPAKEEFKVDPMTSALEYLGSLQPGEQAWIQILIQAHSKQDLSTGSFKRKPDWKKQAEVEIKKLKDEVMQKTEGEGDKEGFKFPLMTKGTEQKIASIERSLDKYPFDVMIRSLYISEWDSFTPANIGGLIGSTRQYNSRNLNGFKLGWYTDYSNMIKDFFKTFRIPEKFTKPPKDRMIEQMLDAYKRRSFFQVPHKHLGGNTPFVLNTEELATMYHFPGGVAQTPTFRRIEAKKAEPPSDLPV